jgi:hypothetical protein
MPLFPLPLLFVVLYLFYSSSCSIPWLGHDDRLEHFILLKYYTSTSQSTACALCLKSAEILDIFGDWQTVVSDYRCIFNKVEKLLQTQKAGTKGVVLCVSS